MTTEAEKAFEERHGTSLGGMPESMRPALEEMFVAGWNAHANREEAVQRSDDEIRERVCAARYRGEWRQIHAIKVHRSLTGSGLKEAKEYVDRECVDLMRRRS